MKNPKRKTSSGNRSDAIAEEVPLQQDAALVIADQFDHALITIKSSEQFSVFDQVLRGGISTGAATIARLGSMLQALPAVLAAKEVNGRQLMEVVVNGDLVRASDGNGFRAFTMGGKGVSEHARLFTTEKLQNMVNAGAVWQIASVVVAQKHLADISKKLDKIGEGVEHLSRFLDQERTSQIQGTYRYLDQARLALEEGEIPASVRTELERCERDLLSISNHMYMELIQGFEKTVPHAETVGTEELALNISKKIREQENLLQHLALCIRTRICAWHVFSLFPGEPKLKEARHADLQQAIEDFGGLAPRLCASISLEIKNISSLFNSQNTLKRRRDALSKQLADMVLKIRQSQAVVKDAVDDSAGLLLKHDEPVRLLFQYQDGILEGVRQLDVQEAKPSRSQ